MKQLIITIGDDPYDKDGHSYIYCSKYNLSNAYTEKYINDIKKTFSKGSICWYHIVEISFDHVTGETIVKHEHQIAPEKQRIELNVAAKIEKKSRKKTPIPDGPLPVFFNAVYHPEDFVPQPDQLP